MKAIFVDKDPVMRGTIHCMAAMAGIDHGVVAKATDAFRLLRGEKIESDEFWSVHGCGIPGDISVIVSDMDLKDMRGMDFAANLRDDFPGIMLFAHAYADKIAGGEMFDRVFFKPHSVEAVVRAVLGVVGTNSERDIFSTMFPSPDNFAA